MANPHDVLAQLLSDTQADALAALGEAAWEAVARVLGALMDAAPTLTSADGRLVMPDEISGKYVDPHIAIPVTLAAANGDAATAYATFPTAALAAFLGVDDGDDDGDDGDGTSDEAERQALATGGTVAAQLVRAMNLALFGDAAGETALTAAEPAANRMGDALELMDEPALTLALAFAGAGGLECTLVLPGTFLELLAASDAEMTPELDTAMTSVPAATGSALPFTLTAEEIDAAELVELPLAAPGRTPARESELVGATAGGGSGAYAQAGDSGGPRTPNDPSGPPPRPAAPPPTPISNAPTAQRARFAPLPEADPPASRGNMDLLSSLQMNVTVELGRTELTVAEVLALGSGSVIELDRLAGEPVDILVNNRIIARGEVVVVDENFGVRVVDVLRRGGEAEERTG